MATDYKPTDFMIEGSAEREATANLLDGSPLAEPLEEDLDELESLPADLDDESEPAISLVDEPAQAEPAPAALPPRPKPTVFVVDDDADVRRVLSVLIKAMDLEVRDFASAVAFLDAFDPQQAGCLLVDVRMPGMSGIELLDELAARSINLPVIMISGHGDVPMAVRVMKAGAVAFLEKPFRDHELWESIQQAIRIDTERRRDSSWRNDVKQRIGRLTPSEREVMDLIVVGESNKSMALRLGVSVRTVEVRRAKVMRKMRVGNMADLIRSALAVNAECAKPQG